MSGRLMVWENSLKEHKLERPIIKDIYKIESHIFYIILLKMNQEHKEAIAEGAMNYWIEYNRKVAKGIYYGDEWLDE